MAAKKYLSHSAGNLQEVQATNSSSGVGSEGDIVALDANGKININMMPAGVGADVKVATANGAIAAKDFVYFEAAGTIAVADNGDAGTAAHGYAPSAINDAEAGDVYFDGIIPGFTGLTIGAGQFLGTGGDIVESGSLPTGTGDIVQKVGVAVSATEVAVEIGHVTILA